MQITLCQFEQINELFNACRHRIPLERLIQSPLSTRDYITEVYFRPEWKLLDACVDAMGLNYADGFASAIDCAAAILTGCMLCTIDIVDEMEAA